MSKTKPAPRVLYTGPSYLRPGGGEKDVCGVATVEGFGHRVVPIAGTDEEGNAKLPRGLKNCVHGRPLIPKPARFGGADPGDLDAARQVCRLCEFETQALLKGSAE